VRTAVIGTGHVGLVTCITLAELGHEVAGTDQDREKIELLQNGSLPFYEPGLQDLLRTHLASGRVRFAPDAEDVLQDADVVFICVGTPPQADGESNLLAVERAARDIARCARPGAVVIEKSTVPAGTAERLRMILHRESGGRWFDVVSNPEFLREGTAVNDSLEPERVLIGGDTEAGLRAARELYEPLIRRGTRLIETDIATAELAKHAANAFLAMKISFANAMAGICERAGADVVAVADVMGSDPRIGRAFLDAGIGFGGFCFHKDLLAFARTATRLGSPFPLLEEVVRINEQALAAVVAKVKESLWNLEDKRIALFGLAFKPGTDDIRFAPALALARRLIAEGAGVVGYDPRAMTNAKDDLPELAVAPDPYEAATGAHCLVVCTDWDEFRELDLDRLRAAMEYPIVIDGRNIFDPVTMRRHGFTYHPTGRPPVIEERAVVA